MIICYYGYKIENVPNKGIFVTEDNRGWLHVVDDPLHRDFFSIEDIEIEFNIILTLRKINKIIELKRN